ncbi:acyclic terpene utilization AtuA family protein [Caulobacter sp.]|uniref:acyclic terpene utilization AtuA family protein n=1 Tax=Caulobacter sp. TaxID=78 RepID=UPI003BAE7475
MSSRTSPVIRLGAGAGFSGDRIEPAIELVREGRLDYLIFECLAERTIALAQRARLIDPTGGYDPLLEARIRAVLPLCVEKRVKIVSNMGAANPRAAARRIAELASELGLKGVKVAAVVGDDVLEVLKGSDRALLETEGDVAGLGDSLISANAYLGCRPIVAALARGADVVVTGRVADPSLFLAPLVHEFGWAMDDWERLGRGTVVGHLLECAGQVTGGYFADPGVKTVPGLARLGFPLAEVAEDGAAVITKVDGSGGRVDVATCTEQLLYELHDPARYLTPDVIADFSTVTFRQIGPDRVAVVGGGGTARPDRLKVSLGRKEGFIGEGAISYAGSTAVARGRLALDIIAERFRLIGLTPDETRFELIGVDAVAPETLVSAFAPMEVRARVVARTQTRDDADRVGREVEALYTNGPAGGGGATRSVSPVIGVVSTLIERDLVEPSVIFEAVA